MAVAWPGHDRHAIIGLGVRQERRLVAARPFARRIAGVPMTMTASGDDLTLTWQNDPAAGDTELFAPKGAVTVSGDVSCSRKGDLVTCHSATSGMKSVKLAPAPPSNCGLTGAEALLVLLLVNRRRRKLRS